MANLTELNIEGVRCWQYTGQLLEKRLPYLQRLRIFKPFIKKEIIKPAHQEETTSLDINNSFVGKKQLEILDLSGNRYMKSLPGSLSEASKLQVLVLDGCDELEHVVLPNSSLRSFSFDGYGPASHWTSTGKLPPMSSRPEYRQPTVDKKDVRASSSFNVSSASSRGTLPTASTSAWTPFATLTCLSLLCEVLVERNPCNELAT
jgi:hypothetical protein